MRKFLLVSPDGIPTTPEPFDTVEKAQAFAAEWVKRYEKQGYYSSASFGRIPLEELPSYLTIVPVDDDETLEASE